MTERVLFGKPLAEVTFADVKKLVEDDQTAESLLLEYKPDLRLDKPNRKGEKDDPNEVLAKKISGFANAFGGYMIIGAKEGKQGKPNEICGVEEDANKFGKKLQHITFEKIYPPVTYAAHKSVEIPSAESNKKKYIHIVHIPKSSIVPHFVVPRGGCWIRHGDDSKAIEGLAEIRELETLLEMRLGYDRIVERELEKTKQALNDVLGSTINTPIFKIYAVPSFPFTLVDESRLKEVSSFISSHYFHGHSPRQWSDWRWCYLSTLIPEDVRDCHIQPLILSRKNNFHAFRWVPCKYDKEQGKHPEFVFIYNWLHEIVGNTVFFLKEIYKDSFFIFDLIFEFKGLSHLHCKSYHMNEERNSFSRALIRDAFFPWSATEDIRLRLSESDFDQPFDKHPVVRICSELTPLFSTNPSTEQDIEYQRACLRHAIDKKHIAKEFRPYLEEALSKSSGESHS